MIQPHSNPYNEEGLWPEKTYHNNILSTCLRDLIGRESTFASERANRHVYGSGYTGNISNFTEMLMHTRHRKNQSKEPIEELELVRKFKSGGMPIQELNFSIPINLKETNQRSYAIWQISHNTTDLSDLISNQKVISSVYQSPSITKCKIVPSYQTPVTTFGKKDLVNLEGYVNYETENLNCKQTGLSISQQIMPSEIFSNSQVHQRCPNLKKQLNLTTIKEPVNKRSQATLISPEDITEKDVLLGRGRGAINHNTMFRKLIVQSQFQYVLARKRGKITIARRIVTHVRRYGGRFLKIDKETELYHDVGDPKATQKASQALREGFSKKIRNELVIRGYSTLCDSVE
jgi:hypothetical protein